MKIAITYRFSKDPTGKRNRLYIPEEFKKIFDKLNVILIPIVSNVGVDDIVDMCDALIIPGSYADTNPKYYHEDPLEGKIYDVDEYAFDSLVLEKFIKSNKPVLGICGGHQEINVYFGGTLNQKINNHCNSELHDTNIIKDTFLYDVYKNETIKTNSFHNQSIKDVAPGFKVSAIAQDGTIEAIEKDNIISVQWHPEVMNDYLFFESFINKYVKK